MNFVLSTIIVVFENIVSLFTDLLNCQGRKGHLNFIIIVLGSIPSVVGYSVLSGFQPFGPGSAVLDLLNF